MSSLLPYGVSILLKADRDLWVVVALLVEDLLLLLYLRGGLCWRRDRCGVLWLRVIRDRYADLVHVYGPLHPGLLSLVGCFEAGITHESFIARRLHVCIFCTRVCDFLS